MTSVVLAGRRGLSILVAVLTVSCARSARHGPDPAVESAWRAGETVRVTKPFSFAVLEDYDKGQDLRDVAEDFALMKELGVTTWRGSFGWDDYEPERGRYDFEWLHRFAELAAREGITLRPYIGYTPVWAATRGADGEAWNDPPARLDDWYQFVRSLVTAMKRHPNIASYEIYNEENVPQWWEGTAAQYNAVLARGAEAIREADPAAEVLFGGMVWPDADFVEAACVTHRNGPAFDILPFHAYPETWTPDSVTVETYLGARFAETFVASVDAQCGRKPIWINETGFATTPGTTEEAQAHWWARAIATFAAEARIEHIGIYEIKDLRRDSPVIGDQPNYYLGLTRTDRTKKLAFHTVDLLTDLLDEDSITVVRHGAALEVAAGRAGELHQHLFARRDGRQLLVVWDRAAGPRVHIRLATPRARATVTEYGINGGAKPYAGFDGRTIRDVQLAPRQARIFVITP